MKIDGLSPYKKIYESYGKPAQTSSNVPFDKKVGFDMDISQRGKEFSLAMEKIKAAKKEQNRDEKIKQLRKQIQDGTYKVDSYKLARAILLGETVHGY